MEWYYNDKKLPHGHRYRTFHDFGIVILDILYCYEENSGVYECRATNKYGSDVTKATLKCASKTNLILESQLPEVSFLLYILTTTSSNVDTIWMSDCRGFWLLATSGSTQTGWG